jgi:hypothetical protein
MPAFATRALSHEAVARIYGVDPAQARRYRQRSEIDRSIEPLSRPEK